MKKTIRPINGKLFLIPGLIAFLFLLSYSAIASLTKQQAGPAFLDHKLQAPRSSSWLKKAIQYASGYEGYDIVLTLDQHLYPALQPIINDFAQREGLKIYTGEGTCGISAGKLHRKEVDIGGFCCPPSVTDRLPGLQFHTLGIAALAMFVHKSNQVDDISLETARKIFSGEIDRWSKVQIKKRLSGLDMAIQPVVRLHCKKRPGHWRLLLDRDDLFGYSVVEVGAISDMIRAIATNKKVIGYEVLWNPERYDKEMNFLKINGFSPADKQHVINHDYPLYRTYNLTTWQDSRTANPHATKLIDYIMKRAPAIDAKFGIILSRSLREAGWKFNNNELIGEPG